MWTSILLSKSFWFIVILAVTNAVSYSSGHQHGYASGKAEVQSVFDTYKHQSLEDAMAEQVKRNKEADALKAQNKEVMDQYESLKTAAGTAIGALDADRMRTLSALRAARHSAAPIDTGTGLPTDATPQDLVLGECLAKYEEVAGDAQQTAVALIALQAYVSKVVPK